MATSPNTRRNYTFSRRDTSILGRWWWTVDRWSLGAITILMGIGILLSFAASPPVADRLNLGGFYFVKRHVIMMFPTLLVLIFTSLMTPKQIRRLASLVYFLGLIFLVLTVTSGMEIKGARRWLSFGSFSIQISEFVKPAFAVLVAWMLAERYRNPRFPGMIISFGILSIFSFLLMMQPDLGMTVVTTAAWIGQLFIAGMPLFWMGLVAGLGVCGLISAYFFFPHVARRIDQFLDPSAGDPKHDLYQVHQSLEAFMNGGLLGKGPGEGTVKKYIPDAHADFIFAVAGEEFGLILCTVVVGLFAFIVVRSFLRILHESSFFIILAVCGLITQFGIQALVNMSSTLHIIPTKGMTMPFISYGGSSLLALAMSMGMVLALTRRRHGAAEIL
ncbi:MAG: putative lipid II flippase FtsW [Alphaproteobacteria bacterium]|nr:putative lipid II flippase FtsW [Alphaproteobacteria bacterium]